MPRSRPVDYPQVHPPSVQPQLGLAPPQGHQHRFSWQDGTDESLNAANAPPHQQRQSSIPPLPTLPDHLGSAAHQGQVAVPAEAVLPSQRAPQFQQPQPNQHQQQAQQQQQIQHQELAQFRPDIPRHLQQQAHPAQYQHPPQQQVSHPGPTPSYEASQEAYRQSQYPAPQPRMEASAVYPGHPNHSQAQLSAHALPTHHPAQTDETPPLPTHDDHQSSETKPTHNPIPLGPDTNPLSPTSPHSPSSPSHPPTTNIQAFPPPTTTSPPTFPQPTPHHTTPHSSRGGSWHHSLLSCADPTPCLSSLFCPCLIYGRVQYRLSLKSSHKDPTNMLGYSPLNGSCVAWSLLCGVNVLMTAIQRTRVRRVYEMESGAGDVLGDCARSLCCCCCVLALDEKEMRVREGVGRGEKSVVESGGTQYVSPEGMRFGPQN